MALEPTDSYVAPSNLQDGFDTSLPIFDVQRVQLRFDISADFVAAAVANNVLILALSTGRILRFDLDNAEDIDDIDLPKRPAEIGVIRSLFLDPSASHLIISTSIGENYYLHTQSRQPKQLARLKGVQIDSVAWNPSQPTASTREILIGATDGNVYETYIEPSTEFYRREEKYVKNVYNVSDGAVIGLWSDSVAGRSDMRRVVIATPNRVLHFVGKTGRTGYEGSGSIYAKFFEHESPSIHEDPKAPYTGPSTLAISPEAVDAAPSDGQARSFAWLCAQGVYHGSLSPKKADGSPFTDAKVLARDTFPLGTTPNGRRKASPDPISSVALTQFHILNLIDGRVVAFNQLDGSLVYDQAVLEPGQGTIGLYADLKKNTYWLFTQRDIFEIVVTDEARHVWKIMLKNQDFELASRYAKTPSQKDAVATASGDHLVSRGRFAEAAAVYGRSTKPFEEVALTFIDKSEQ
ncbi:Pep3/Vps18/deep orange family-domain-containing protein, partial [Delphinella strobiligena]